MVEMVVDRGGAVTDCGIYRAQVRNQAKLAYNGVAAWLKARNARFSTATPQQALSRDRERRLPGKQHRGPPVNRYPAERPDCYS